MRGNLRNVVAATPQLHCNYEELPADVEENAILLWALHVASRLTLSRDDVRRQIRRAYRNLVGDVSLEPKAAHDCLGRFYNRLNDDYRPMHGLCCFLIEHTGPSVAIAEHKFLPFQLNVQYFARLNANADLSFIIDLVLRDRMSGQALAVIDTKYKLHETPSEDDVKSMVAYAVRLGVSKAYLVYPFRLARPIEAKIGSVDVSAIGRRPQWSICGNLGYPSWSNIAVGIVDRNTR
jgi:5-methylcytosine-specific restriction enzyme subunit McrC